MDKDKTEGESSSGTDSVIMLSSSGEAPINHLNANGLLELSLSDETDQDFGEDEHFDELEIATENTFPFNPIENYDSSSATPPDVEDFNSSFELLKLKIAEASRNNKLDSSSANDSDRETWLSDKDKNGSKKVSRLFDGKIDKSTQHECIQCEETISSMYMLCLRCFKVRRSWLPTRPPSRRLKKIKRALHFCRHKNAVGMWQNRVKSYVDKNLERDNRNAGTSSQHRHLGQSGSSPTLTLYQRGRVHEFVRQKSESIASDRHIDLNAAFIMEEENPVLEKSASTQQSQGMLTFYDFFSSHDSSNQSKNCQIPNSNCSNKDKQSEKDNVVADEIPIPRKRPAETESNNDTTSLKKQKQDICTRNQNSTTSSDSDSLCQICFSNPKNAAFVHNKIAHFCCCYSCGDKILKKDGKCPICRSRVLRLVKVVST